MCVGKSTEVPSKGIVTRDGREKGVRQKGGKEEKEKGTMAWGSRREEKQRNEEEGSGREEAFQQGYLDERVDDEGKDEGKGNRGIDGASVQHASTGMAVFFSLPGEDEGKEDENHNGTSSSCSGKGKREEGNSEWEKEAKSNAYRSSVFSKTSVSSCASSSSSGGREEGGRGNFRRCPCEVEAKQDNEEGGRGGREDGGKEWEDEAWSGHGVEENGGETRVGCLRIGVFVSAREGGAVQGGWRGRDGRGATFAFDSVSLEKTDKEEEARRVVGVSSVEETEIKKGKYISMVTTGKNERGGEEGEVVV